VTVVFATLVAAVGRRLAALTRGRRLLALAFCAFFLVSAAWAVAAPYNGFPDEVNHVIRAAGVARGQFLPEQDPSQDVPDIQRVPRGLVHAEVCWQSQPQTPAACGSGPTGETALVRTPTTAGRYQPAYYLAVGWALALWPNWAGVIIARLIGAALSALLLAFAAYGAARWSAGRLLPCAVLVATTPITLYIAAGFNPSGIEVAAGLALFVALVPVIAERGAGAAEAGTGKGRPVDGDSGGHGSVAGGPAPLAAGAVHLAGASAVALAIVRPFGPLWLAIALAVLLVPVRRTGFRDRLRWLLSAARAHPRWVGGVGLALASTFGWMLAARTDVPGLVYPPFRHLAFTEAVRIEVFGRSASYANQLVGVMSWLDTPLPSISYPLWFMAFGVLFLTAFAVGQWPWRVRLAGLGVATFAVPILAEAINVNTFGFVTQGRCVLPIAVGLPVLSAWVVARTGALSGDNAVRLTRTIAPVLVAIHLGGLWFTMIRWQWGVQWVQGMNPFTGRWLPPLGPAVPLCLGVLGGAALLTYGWYAAATAEPDDAADRQRALDDPVALDQARQLAGDGVSPR
jgi:hypothetical protein